MKIVQAGTLTPAQRRAAAELYWLAFGSKLGRVMGPAPKALAFIERVVQPRHALLALDDAGEVLGVVGFRTAQGCFVGGDLGDLRAVYGRFGALWRRACLQVLARDEASESIAVDGLAVRAEARGKGVGAALLEAVCALAMARGHTAIRLDVVEENLRARALYIRHGFVQQERRHSRLTRLLFDFHSVHVMVRRF
jgi:ribosomal protein S18 acetylase RimI-like enzyme